MPRLDDTSLLHPLARQPIEALASELMVAGVPLRIYETGRTPFRQAELYAYGRNPDKGGPYKTHAKAWDSFHQFGFAADFVFLVNGQWTWAEPESGMWAEFQSRAKARGLRTLAFEKPHVELALSLEDLHAGNLPPFTGELGTWARWLQEQGELWSAGNTGCPHWITLMDARPDLSEAPRG